jgi:serine/threonine protein kinase
MNDEPTKRSTNSDPHAAQRHTLPLGAPPFIGRYETLRVLGNGTFGRVYLAFDPGLERYVAIKMPKDPLPQESHRGFLREARAVANLHHPNVCPVHDVGTLLIADGNVQEELPFIVMHYATGGTLEKLLTEQGGSLIPRVALRIAEQIARGLEAVHACGIFHRDLKLANVVYDKEAPLITDFGVARWTDATNTLGGMPGTPAYMAPEQWGQAESSATFPRERTCIASACCYSAC